MIDPSMIIFENREVGVVGTINIDNVKTADMVSHPPHYQSKSGIEVIDVVEAFTEELTGIEATDTGNIIKYICRWKNKNGIEDLKKAQWYINHLIKHIENKNELKESNES